MFFFGKESILKFNSPYIVIRIKGKYVSIANQGIFGNNSKIKSWNNRIYLKDSRIIGVKLLDWEEELGFGCVNWNHLVGEWWILG